MSAGCGHLRVAPDAPGVEFPPVPWACAAKPARCAECLVERCFSPPDPRGLAEEPPLSPQAA